MADFEIQWTKPVSTIYKQELYLRLRYTSEWSLITELEGEVFFYTATGLLDNKIYEYKIKSYCLTSGPGESVAKSFIKINCPTFTTSNITLKCDRTFDYSFLALGQDIDAYDVVLLNNAGTELSRQTKTTPLAVGSAVTGTFSSLEAETIYKIRLEPKADEFTRTTCGIVTVTTYPDKPVLVTSPGSVARCDDGPNSITTLTAVITGNQCTYRWYRNDVLIVNGANYTGATTLALRIENAGTILGTFKCTAENICGSVTTTGAVITLIPDTSIVTQPTIAATCPEVAIPLSINVSGNTITYQWQKSIDAGVTYTNITGATAATYTIPGAGITNGHKYRAVVNSFCGPEINSVASTVQLKTPIGITTHPETQLGCKDDTVTFTAAALGTGLAYQWQVKTALVDWTNIAGKTAATLDVVVSDTNDGNKYRVVCSGDCNTVTSTEATLTKKAVTSITTTPGSQTVKVGESATFTVVAAGYNLRYQWQKSTNGGSTYTNITNETAASLTFEVNLGDDQNRYRVVVTGDCSTVVSAGAVLTAVVAPTVGTLDSQTICPDTTTAFGTTVTGNYLTYKWQKLVNAVWTDIASSNTVSYATGTVGSYRIIVSNFAGTVTSNAATLSISTQIVDLPTTTSTLNLAVGDPFTLSVTNYTFATFQWYKSTDGGVTYPAITSATTSSYTGAAVTLSDDGVKYKCKVTGPCNEQYSAVVTLNVSAVYTITWLMDEDAGTTQAGTGTFVDVNMGITKNDVRVDLGEVGGFRYTGGTGTFTALDGDTIAVSASSEQPGETYAWPTTGLCTMYIEATGQTAVSTSNSGASISKTFAVTGNTTIKAYSTFVAAAVCNAPTGVSATLNTSTCTCPTGFTLNTSQTSCTKETTVAASGSGQTFTAAKGATDPSYCHKGLRIYNVNDYNLAGNTVSGGYAHSSNTGSFWSNPTSNLTAGRLNAISVWKSNDPNYVGTLTFCATFNVPTDKTYYVGISGDNYVSFQLDGITKVNHTNYVSSVAIPNPFNVWHVYPVVLTAGTHQILLSCNNYGFKGGFAAEIYDNTVAQIAAATSTSSLTRIFSTENYLPGGPNAGGGFCSNYSCPAGYTLDLTNPSSPICRKVENTTPTCGAGTVTYIIEVSGGFSPSNQDGINDTFNLYQYAQGTTVYTVVNYAQYPNMTWEIVDQYSTVWYRNLTGAVYVPWNGRLNNASSGSFYPYMTAFYYFALNDGTGRTFQASVTVF